MKLFGAVVLVVAALAPAPEERQCWRVPGWIVCEEVKVECVDGACSERWTLSAIPTEELATRSPRRDR